MNEKYEEKVKKHLKKETESIKSLKEEVWMKIDNQISDKEVVKETKKGKINKVIPVISMAAIIMLMFATFFTDAGQAVIKSIQSMFVKEKNIEFNIEGETEEIEVELGLNEELSYVIYVDKSRYKLIAGEQSDKIIPNEEFKDIPNVMLKIFKEKDTTQQQVIANIKDNLKQLDMEIRIEEAITKPFDGILISVIGKGAANENGINGVDWDSPVYRYYVMEEQAGELFVIEEQYFLEAAEGHGARFASMLETFEVIIQN